MANSNGWGDGAANNAIGWGQGANNAIGWGDSHSKSWAGATDIVGTLSPSFDEDAEAFITAANITDATQKTAIDNLVIGLKADGLWTNIQALYPFVGGTASTHKWNLKDPRDLNAAYRLTFSGGITHSNNGVTLNGINGVVDTNFVGFQTGQLGAYNRGGNLGIGGTYSVNWEGDGYPIYFNPSIELFVNNNFILSYFSNSIDYSNNLIVNLVNANLGFSVISGGSGLLKLYRNGTLLNSYAPDLPTDSLPISLWLGGINYGYEGNSPSSPVYLNSQIAFGFITTNIFNATQNANLNTRVQAFQTALSRNV